MDLELIIGLVILGIIAVALVIAWTLCSAAAMGDDAAGNR